MSPLRPCALPGVLAIAVLLAGCGSVGGLIGLPNPGVSENTPPAVTSVVPAADGVAPSDTPITATFNKAMSLDALDIKAEPSLSFGPAQWSDDAKTVTVRPNPSLVPGIRYTVRLRARDRQGNSLAADYTWSFSAMAPTGVAGEGRLRLAERIDVGLDARVFTLFAAIAAASAEDRGGEPGSVGAAVKAKMAELPSRVADPVRRFINERQAPVEQYLAAALQLSAPPEFRESAVPGRAAAPAAGQQPVPVQRPPAAAGGTSTPRPESRDLSGLGPVLSQFYASAGIGDLWKAHERAYAEALEAHRKEASALLGRAADYMRVTAVPGGRITVLPNLLGAPGQGFLVRQGDRTYLVAGAPVGVDRLGLVRPFVRMLLDPVRGQSPDQVQRTEPLFLQAREVAARGGYRAWSEIVAESLVEATAIRLALSGDAAAAAVRAAYTRGLVLVDHFSAQLTDYERTATTLVEFYPRMVAAVDLELELRRWAERKPN